MATNKDKQQDLSSAELTVNYRCAFPELSGDKLSFLLSSNAGRQLAGDFISKYDYLLVGRKISVCAGYFLKEVTRLIETGLYDSVISFASGFSLLTYLIAEKNPNFPGLFFDTDLPYMITERNKRIEAMDKTNLDPNILNKLQSKHFDIEHSYEEKTRLKDIFPDCKRPIFVLDGVSYFLSAQCVNWLIKEMGSYEYSAATLYYWPQDMFSRSALFARVFSDLNQGMIKEDLKSFWDENTVNQVRSYFSNVSDASLEEVERNMVHDVHERQLLDPNQFFPVRLITMERNV